MKRSKNIYKKGLSDILKSMILPVVFTLAVVGMIAFGLNQTSESSRSEGLRVLEDSLMRATVKCYAVEGRYPESVAYIENNYGVHIDKAKYAVHYEIFASNLFPEITVVELLGG
ncbi:MAG: hypothetical protein FWG48_03080 [Oscillospiraceae bacterium]|jgi:hypothetical protein|nr:hypothetical protein [Oscillospiraceae bacterium]